MKIAIFHELHSGGARRAVNEFAKQLKKQHEVDSYVVDEEENLAEREYFSDVSFYKFIAKKWQGGNWKIKLYKDTLELYHLYRLHIKIASDINKKKYDLVFVHPSKFTQAPFILRFIKDKTCYYCQEPLRILYDPVFSKIKNIKGSKKLYEKSNRFIRKSIDKYNISRAGLVLANSKHSQANITNAYGIRSIVCYLGVDSETFRPLHIKKDIDVLFIGTKESSEGYSLLEESLTLMKRIPQVYTHITGKDWIAGDKEFARLYNRSKLVVCLAKSEPFGLIPLEAMACGIPVVAVKEGGYKESVVDGKTGFLVTREPKELAKRLEQLLSSSDLLYKMSKNARKHIVRNWTWERSVKSLEGTIKNCFPDLQ